MYLAEKLFGSHLEEEEKIHFIARRHIFTVLKKLTVIMTVGICFPIIFYFLFPPLKFLWIAWFIGGLVKYLYKLADWYFDAWLITNIGIIDVEWNGFFDRSSARIEYQTVKGINYNIKGVWGTILNFGDITLETYAGGGNHCLEKASNPPKVERQILTMQDKFVTNKTFGEHESLKALLTTLIEKSANQK